MPLARIGILTVILYFCFVIESLRERNKQRRQRLERRDAKIKKRYIELRGRMYKGKVPEYSQERIFFMMEEEFNLSRSYIERIVFNHVRYK